MNARKLNYYQQSIVDATNCQPNIAPVLEEIMREDIFHSTLDWQTKKEFNDGAIEAKEMFDYVKANKDSDSECALCWEMFSEQMN